eukprot:15457047-Alexandrium_andersonii.AAC.1
MRRGKELAARIPSSGMDLDKRLRLATGKVLPMSLYGAPASPVARSELASMRYAMARLVEPKLSGGRALDM